jgi:hypothetical protein
VAFARFCAALAAVSLVASGCAHTDYYDADGKELKGLPVVYRDAAGGAHLVYVTTSTGFGQSSFTVTRDEAGGYTEFTTNLDSTAAATLTGGLIDKISDVAFSAGKKAAAAEMSSELQELPNSPQKQKALEHLRDLQR